MSKHIITKKTLLKELKKNFISDLFIAIFVMALIGILLFILFIALFLPLFSKDVLFNITLPPSLKPFVAVVFISLLVFMCFITIRDSLFQYLTIKRKKYKVVTAVLTDLKEKVIRLRNSIFTENGNPHTLIFEKYGEYYIASKNYTSDPYTTMTDDQVFNSSFVKDAFILVLNKKNKILLAYNTKLFEYQE